MHLWDEFSVFRERAKRRHVKAANWLDPPGLSPDFAPRSQGVKAQGLRLGFLWAFGLDLHVQNTKVLCCLLLYSYARIRTFFPPP